MLTAEQQKVIDTALSNDSRILAVNSIAGSGKTSTSVALVNAFEGKKIFYTAFNKSIVTDSAKKLGKKAEAKTIHALAYQYVKPKRKIEELTYTTIKEPISYEDKAIVIDSLDDFFRSSYVDIYDYATTRTKDESLQELIVNYAEMMLEGKIPPTFNYTLKCLHLMLLHEEITIDYDLLILDECLTANTMIATDTHDRTIKSICNSLIRGEKVMVKSFNERTKEFEFKEAINPLISKNRDVIEIRTEGLNKLQCTPTHKIRTQRGYVCANELKVGEDYLLLDSPEKQKTKYILNKEQYQVMLGSYLGDGSLQKQSKFNTYRLNFTQGVKQLNYLKWKTDSFNLTNSIKPIKSGYTGKEDVYQSNYSPTFILDDAPFNLVLRDLDSLGLAIWFMDDGSKDRINSNNFSKEENEQLRDMLIRRFNLHTEVKQDSKGFYYLYFIKNAKNCLFFEIEQYLHKDIAYKLNCEGVIPKALDNKFMPYGGNFVTSIKNIAKQTVYDFEVKDNHNFLASHSKNSTKVINHNCQDTTAVALEIFKLINAKHKVMFGDKYQNIYSFMNTVNAFDELDDINLLRLTKSFRCNSDIASIVDEYGKYYLEDSFVFKGNEDIEKESQFKVAYITRTNAMLIERMFHLMNEGQSFTLTRNPNEIFALPIAMLNAANGKEVYDKKYKFLEKEYKNFDKVRRSYRSFYEYINSIMEDPLIEMVTKVLGNFANKRINIYDVKAKVLALKPNPNIVLTTAHAFKGLEMDNVYIEEDLNSSVNRTIQRMKDLSTIVDGNPRLYLSKEQKEDLNTYYVALSRSRINLINVKYIT